MWHKKRICAWSGVRRIARTIVVVEADGRVSYARRGVLADRDVIDSVMAAATMRASR